VPTAPIDVKEKKDMYLPKQLLVGVTVVMAMAATAAGALGATHSTTGPTAKVAVANSGLGRILVDGHGHTLYLFAKDKRGRSSCAGQCAAFWPPLISSGKPRAAAGAKASLLGTTRRADGRLQVTYNHHPLYTFVKDTSKGQTNGEGVNAFGAEWDTLSTAGSQVEKTSSSTTNPSPGGYGGYGY
jgi:predicted lipoprotein with Yx(FWY)xxD motif